MAYHTLLIRHDATSKWTPQFGDHDKEVVKQESDDNYGGIKKSNRKIVTTPTSHQYAVSAAIDALNGELIAR